MVLSALLFISWILTSNSSNFLAHCFFWNSWVTELSLTLPEFTSAWLYFWSHLQSCNLKQKLAALIATLVLIYERLFSFSRRRCFCFSDITSIRLETWEFLCHLFHLTRISWCTDLSLAPSVLWSVPKYLREVFLKKVRYALLLFQQIFGLEFSQPDISL